MCDRMQLTLRLVAPCWCYKHRQGLISVLFGIRVWCLTIMKRNERLDGLDSPTPVPEILWGESRNCSHKRPANEQNDFRLSPKFSLSILRFKELNILI